MRNLSFLTLTGFFVLFPLTTGTAFSKPASTGERLEMPDDRAPVVRRTDENNVYLGWRLLPEDDERTAFNVYRTSGGETVRVNETPIRQSTNIVDDSAPESGPLRYAIKTVHDGTEADRSFEITLNEEGGASTAYHSIPLGDETTFQRIGIDDLNGDDRFEFVIKTPNKNVDPWYKYWKPSPGTYKLQAYQQDGTRLWQYDMGWSIEQGIWYSPYIVYDIDQDGQAEVVAKTGEGDPRGKEGKVESGPEYMTVFEGASGEPIARTDWISREPFYDVNDRWAYNYASRNQIAVAYLDGKSPHIIMARGQYNLIIVDAYRFDGSSLERVWRWDNRNASDEYWGKGSHWIQTGDLEGDGRDEVVIGSAVIDDDGNGLWATGLEYPDHQYLGEINPSNEGLEIYYGIEGSMNENGMCLVDAATGDILWGYDGPTNHVHGRGMSSDISAAHPGRENYSSDKENGKITLSRLWTSEGVVLNKENKWGFGIRTVRWDGDPQREIIEKNGDHHRVRNFRGSTYKVKLEGHVVAVADVRGDWREEIITNPPGELRIYTSTIPADHRRVSPLFDPIYRKDIAHQSMGYPQTPMSRRRPGDDGK